MQPNAQELADAIYLAATPVLQIHRLFSPRWKRNIAQNPTDARIGPWLQADYKVIDESVWREKGACLYLVRTNDGHLRYVGISRNGVKHRWRTSPAYDAETMIKLPQKQLFHSQCWRHMEATLLHNPSTAIEVRSIQHPVLSRLGPPLSGFLALEGDGEGMCAGVERWLCNRSNGEFLAWNTAMTGKR